MSAFIVRVGCHHRTSNRTKANNQKQQKASSQRAFLPDPSKNNHRFRLVLLRRSAEIMTTIRPFVCDDLLTFNNINLDKLTETVFF
jgi:hypothetical protein